LCFVRDQEFQVFNQLRDKKVVGVFVVLFCAASVFVEGSSLAGARCGVG
jgi:hypothetical protein